MIMPDKLYQECRTLISGCRAIFEDLREAGIDTLPLAPGKIPPVSNVPHEYQTPKAQAECSAPPETLADIQQELASCQRCARNSERTQVVFGVGNPAARLVLVGEHSDAEEERQEEPFPGEAGLLLERILFAMKLSRDDVYICNLLKCRTPHISDSGKAEVAACETSLKRQLAAIAPEMILSLGSFASQTLLQSEEAIGKLRGRWQSYAGIPLMPTFHPADLLQNPAGKHQVWEDVKQVMHRLQEGEG